MKPIGHPPLPLATTSPFTAFLGQARADAAAGWARQFAGAQELVPGDKRSPGATPLHPARTLPDVPQPALRVDAVGTRAVAHVAAMPTQAIAGTQQPNDAEPHPPAWSVEGRGSNEAPAVDDEPDHSPTRRTPRAPAQPEVRVHLQETPEGVALWLGMNGADATARAAALLPELRRVLECSSQRLAALVCNGQRIHSTPESLQEKT